MGHRPGEVNNAGAGRMGGGSPDGQSANQICGKNPFGILDHDVMLESGVKIHNPMRVVPNGRGSEVIFILFRQPDMSDAQFAADAQWVEKD